MMDDILTYPWMPLKYSKWWKILILNVCNQIKEFDYAQKNPFHPLSNVQWFWPRCSFPCTGMKQEAKLRMRVEPGLFEWTKWVSGNSLPAWISPIGLAAANLSVDTTYKYKQITWLLFYSTVFLYLHAMKLLSESNINHQRKYLYIHRPHIPITKLNVSESYDTYMSRSYRVTKDIMADCKNKGKYQISVLP